MNDPKFLPVYQTPGAANADLVANLGTDDTIVIDPGTVKRVDCGFCMQLPLGFKAEFSARSGWSSKGLIVANAPSQIDEDYRGRIVVLLVNVGLDSIVIKNNDRIAQMWPAPVYKFEWITNEPLEESVRGTGGFGSTGTR